jgi:hypothetical protein
VGVLITLVTGASAEEKPMSLQESITNALQLLNYASEHAKTVSQDVVLAITQANAAEANNTMTPEIEAQFWTSFSKLADSVKPVTVESLSPECNTIARKERRYYSIWSISLLLIIIPISIASFATNSIIDELEQKADIVCKREPDLKCANPALSGVPAGYPTDAALANRGDLKATIELMYFRLRWLDRLLLYQYSITELDKIFGHGALAGDFQGAIYYGRDLKERAGLGYGVLTGYILPVLYAMLGAVAYGLRDLSDNVTARTILPSSRIRARVRFRLAILAGVVVGLFTDFTKGISLSPLAFAFLIGYSVEIFLSFLDAMVEAAKKTRSEQS